MHDDEVSTSTNKPLPLDVVQVCIKRSLIEVEHVVLVSLLYICHVGSRWWIRKEVVSSLLVSLFLPVVWICVLCLGREWLALRVSGTLPLAFATLHLVD